MVLLFQLHKALGKRANRQAETAFKQRQVKETLESTSALKREREEQQKEEAETRHQQNSLANGGIPSGALARPGARMVNVNLIDQKSAQEDFLIPVWESMYVWELKLLVQERKGVPTQRQRLIVNNKVMKDERTLGDYKIGTSKKDDGRPVQIALRVTQYYSKADIASMMMTTMAPRKDSALQKYNMYK